MNQPLRRVSPSPSDLGIRVLVVQKNGRLREALVVQLERLGCAVVAVDSSEGALNAVEHQSYVIAFVDPSLGPESGLTLSTRLLAESPSTSVVLIAACSNLQTLASAVSHGTCGHISTSFTPGQVRQIVEKAVEDRSLRQRLADHEDRLRDAEAGARIVAESPAMRSLGEHVLRAAQSEAPVLLRGEVGTGKGVQARVLHARGARAGGPFVVARCLGPTSESRATELFGLGYSGLRGAMTAQPGQIEDADGGTLFIEEVGDLDESAQARLLRLLQEGGFHRVGETRSRKVDVRVVAATTEDLETRVRNGLFREDLYYLLSATDIEVPPLRKRGEDILPLARGFVSSVARRLRKRVPELAEAAQRALKNYNWPGNVRELRNMLERAVMLCPSGLIGVDDLPACVSSGVVPAPHLGGDFTIEEIEREHIVRVVQRAPKPTVAARILGIGTGTLWRRRKAFGC